MKDRIHDKEGAAYPLFLGVFARIESGCVVYRQSTVPAPGSSDERLPQQLFLPQRHVAKPVPDSPVATSARWRTPDNSLPGLHRTGLPVGDAFGARRVRAPVP